MSGKDEQRKGGIGMFFEMTVQFRAADFEEAGRWYETLLKRKPDFTPHEGFAEWELLPGCWLQVAEGEPAEGSGPLRLAVADIEAEKERLMSLLDIEDFEVFTRDGVPVRWGTFSDPWGNRLGMFEYLDKETERKRQRTVFEGGRMDS